MRPKRTVRKPTRWTPDAGATSRTEAIKKAEAVAERMGEVRTGATLTGPRPSGLVTLGRVLDLYFKEVVPHKKPDTQKQNDTDRRMLPCWRAIRPLHPADQAPRRAEKGRLGN